jgi:hypothetical protein
MNKNTVMNLHTNMNTCNNCGKLGHQFNQCKLPIISYGIILFTCDPNDIYTPLKNSNDAPQERPNLNLRGYK